MYNIGDYIVRANTGVCTIVDILPLDTLGIDKNKLYYQLMPFDDDKAIIYIAVERAHSVTRKIMTHEEAMKLMSQANDIKPLQIVNDKLREQQYKKLIKENKPKELLQIIKTTYLRKTERLAQGKKITRVDEVYFKIAEKQLVSELSIVFEKNIEEIQKLIIGVLNCSIE